MAGASRITLLGLLLSFLPGVKCDNYSITAMVVSSIVAFIMFAVVIFMLVLVSSYNIWLPKYQRQRGKVKGPRPKPPPKVKKVNPPFFGDIAKTSSLPASQGHSQPPSIRQTNTLTDANMYNIKPNVDKTDSWIQEVPTPRESEKVAQMQFYDEDEDVIVTEIVMTEDTVKKNGAPVTIRNSQITDFKKVEQQDGKIEITLKKEPLPENNDDQVGMMNFGFEDDNDDDEAVANFSNTRTGGEESTVLY